MREEAEKVIAEYLGRSLKRTEGTIDVIEVTDTRVVVRLSGTCAGCPGQPYTLSRVIEPALKQALGADIQVEARFAV